MLAITLYASAVVAAPAPERAASDDASLPGMGPSRPAPPALEAAPAVSTMSAASPQRRAALATRALAVLSAATSHDDPDIRVLAMEQWGLLGNKAAAVMLLKALKDPSANVRVAAAGALYQLDDKTGVAVVERLAEPAVPAKKPAKGAKPAGELSGIDELRAAARNKTRVLAIRMLGRMGERSSIPVLLKGKEDPSGVVRDAANAALARAFTAEEEVRQFTDSLESPDQDLRLSAAKALLEVGGSESLAALERAAADDWYQVRAAAMEALGATGDVAAVPALRKGIMDPHELVRAKAVAGLCRIGDKAAAPPLRDMATLAKNVFIQLLAIGGLVRLGEKVDVAVVQRSLSQKDVETRQLAVEVLEAVGPTEHTLENLEYAMEDEEARVRVRAAAAVVKLLRRPS